MLRAIRYGEADRVLHIYTEARGRVGAIAKGVRRTTSRFGGRLEPFFRADLMLYEGRGELLKVTGAQTRAAHLRLREKRQALEAATQGCEAVLRLMQAAEPNQAAYNLLCRYLGLLDERAGRSSHVGQSLVWQSPEGQSPEGQPPPAKAIVGMGPSRGDDGAAWPTLSLAFRLKLLWAAGFVPQLADCASCGRGKHLTGFSAAAGGAVCDECAGGSFALPRDSLEFMRNALQSPMAEIEPATSSALGRVDRAVLETLGYHAHVRLRPVPVKFGKVGSAGNSDSQEEAATGRSSHDSVVRHE